MLVTLLGDVATYYAQVRTFEQRIAYARTNVDLQRQTLRIAEARYKAGTTAELDVLQARSTLEQTEGQIAELEISLRQANNQLCVLLGIPPEELRSRLGPGHILTAPAEVAAGIPADLLRRRPDVRRAERQAAAQSAQIGVAEADFYPHISITGTINYSAGTPLLPRPAVLGGPVTPMALEGNIGPTFQWNILNYGRIMNNVRLQDARFQELVAAYQSTVLTAAQEVENGLVTFLQAQERRQVPGRKRGGRREGRQACRGPVQGGDGRFHPGHPDRAEPGAVAGHARAGRGEIGLGLIQVYRALGGGWQIRLTGCETTALPPQGVPRPPDGTRLDPGLTPVSAPPKPPPKDEKAPMSERRHSSGVGFASLREEP